MNTNYLISSAFGKKLYDAVKDLPIVDYHCHLSPKEIFEDKPFDNIGEMWLGGDHYKWRLMRASGVDEEYVTGSASWKDKFIKYAESIEFAAGNPLYYWTKLELDQFFGITEQLTAANAEEIWEKANAVIREKKLSPRKLILDSKVEFIATTDDICDNLAWHAKIKEDPTFAPVVTPSFRCDNLLLIRKPDYADYVKKLSGVVGFEIQSIDDLEKAICQRLDFFKANGCIFTDVGIEFFPDHIGTKEEADKVFKAALKGEPVCNEAYYGFLGYLDVFLGCEYKKRGLTMQMHLAVKRNANSVLAAKLGADVGVDCVGDAISGNALISILDAINVKTGLPKTILYTLNPSMTTQLSSIAGCFSNVILGAAWWFCDHVRGNKEQIRVIAETTTLNTFLGMLTDSRSVLSYARHDFFRRLLCEVVGEWVDKGEFTEEAALKVAEGCCYGNVKKIVG